MLPKRTRYTSPHPVCTILGPDLRTIGTSGLTLKGRSTRGHDQDYHTTALRTFPSAAAEGTHSSCARRRPHVRHEDETGARNLSRAPRSSLPTGKRDNASGGRPPDSPPIRPQATVYAPTPPPFPHANKNRQKEGLENKRKSHIRHSELPPPCVFEFGPGSRKDCRSEASRWVSWPPTLAVSDAGYSSPIILLTSKVSGVASGGRNPE
ncbi:hypothetical protein K438DRAFT_1771311 [Mycena galopus ATCC 62051]|nr:hypothetical protein K438DRAFT_1771311 [Mycena galopus ATCC 62051]